MSCACVAGSCCVEAKELKLRLAIVEKLLRHTIDELEPYTSYRVRLIEEARFALDPPHDYREDEQR